MEQKQGTVIYDDKLLNPAQIVEMIDDMGFGAKLADGNVTISIEGMTCMSCVNSIESRLRETPGILSVKVIRINHP